MCYSICWVNVLFDGSSICCWASTIQLETTCGNNLFTVLFLLSIYLFFLLFCVGNANPAKNITRKKKIEQKKSIFIIHKMLVHITHISLTIIWWQRTNDDFCLQPLHLKCIQNGFYFYGWRKRGNEKWRAKKTYQKRFFHFNRPHFTARTAWTIYAMCMYSSWMKF